MTESGRWRHTQTRPALKATDVSAFLAELSQQSVPNSTAQLKKKKKASGISVVVLHVFLLLLWDDGQDLKMQPEAGCSRKRF